MAKKILLIDDDDTLRESLFEQLQLLEEFSATEATCASDALAIIQEGCFDVVLLDVDLPDLDGWEVCHRMRQSGFRAPIIMLSGPESDAEWTGDQDTGANDCIAKPFRLSVLLARINAQLRQHELIEGGVFTIGPYSFRPAQKLLVSGGERKVRLTEKETAILKYLYRAGDTVVSREKLLGEVWGYNVQVTTHTLETHVYRLRQKIEAEPSNARILVTAPGGYRLIH
ncbi:MAG: DNA-binding response regulator [Alphaproteobacteria bacterium]|nr:DNA-binding response regulator [Alphaproteobacteria bacterium]HCP01663.1 DNA-binding response regulator [Rhodospirillaceae bacterium]